MHNLRHKRRFPAFEKIPDEFDLDLRYYDEDGNLKLEWCLLGEVVQSVMFGRLHVTLKDKKGEEFMVSFYTDDDGAGVDPKDVQNGNTMAIKSPASHSFLDGSEGIRQEDYDSVRFLPFSLDELLEANDHLHAATGEDGELKCHSCGKESKQLSKCGRCKMFWYCDKECQTDAWLNKGHKRDCKVLKDPLVRELLNITN